MFGRKKFGGFKRSFGGGFKKRSFGGGYKKSYGGRGYQRKSFAGKKSYKFGTNKFSKGPYGRSFKAIAPYTKR